MMLSLQRPQRALLEAWTVQEYLPRRCRSWTMAKRSFNAHFVTFGVQHLSDVDGGEFTAHCCTAMNCVWDNKLTTY